ncbi:MAG TPA: hypothetical protein VGI38_07510 [Puia sp.]
MSNLSDKEIDRLSREAADSYEPNDSSLSWSRLEQKLAQQMPERPPDGFRFGRINPYVWGPAVVLLAGASIFFVKNIFYSQHSTRNSQTLTQPISLPDADNKNASQNTIRLDSSASVQGTAVEGNNDNAIKGDEKSGSAVSGLTTNAGKLIAPGSNKTSANQYAVSGKKRTGGRADAMSANQPGNATAGSPTGSGRGISNEEMTQGKMNGFAEITGAALLTNISQNKNTIHLPVVITNGTGLGKVSGNDSMMNQLAQSKNPIHQKSLHLNRSLNIGFAFGPDYTNAGGIANNQIGNYIGLTIGYYLTDKFSINTGILYTNKFYWSDAHNYFFRQPPNITPVVYARSFAAPPPIDYINGASNIWELPLTLRFDFAHHNKTKFFANAGMSSYFMMKQTYIYFLHSGQNQLAYKISDNQQVNYWFGVADISTGFEAELGKGFSFQAEPFLKIPLRNMGTEDLKLTSYGFLMTFKYSPVLGRSKK